MMRKLLHIAAALVIFYGLVPFVFPGISFAAATASETTTDELEAVQADLGLRLLVALAKQERNAKNVQASPASLAAVFSYLHLGADPIMKQAIAKMLGFGPDKGEVAITKLRQSAKTLSNVSAEKGPLAFANAMFVRSPGTLKPGASDLLAAEGMSTSLANLGTQEGIDKVNKYVADHTANLIPKLLKRLYPDAFAAAVNALYFKDKWIKQFDPKETRREPFHLLDGEAVVVDMMHLRTALAARADNSFSAVKLPYQTPGYSLILVTTNGQSASVTTFAGISDWLVGAKFRKMDVNLSLPKFTVGTNFQMLSILERLGLSEGTSSPEPFPLLFHGSAQIDEVIQACVIKIDEAGTEAAAATAVIIGKSLPQPPKLIEFDRPFVYALRDENNGMILLTGYVGDPSAE